MNRERTKGSIRTTPIHEMFKHDAAAILQEYASLVGGGGKRNGERGVEENLNHEPFCTLIYNMFQQSLASIVILGSGQYRER